ncbi:MAG: type II secretion system protein [Sandarakinorhabdus sp.]|nr:type II secretion system protein [Sandarakinorhabdus sp.]
MTPAQRERGSVLVEALVAVLIVAAMAGLWFDTLAQGVRQQGTLADRRIAMLVAQSRLAVAGVAHAGGGQDSSGSNAGMDWRIRVEPYPDAGDGIEMITVSVGKPGGTVLANLQSLRIGQ